MANRQRLGEGTKYILHVISLKLLNEPVRIALHFYCGRIQILCMRAWEIVCDNKIDCLSFVLLWLIVIKYSCEQHNDNILHVVILIRKRNCRVLILNWDDLFTTEFLFQCICHRKYTKLYKLEKLLIMISIYGDCNFENVWYFCHTMLFIIYVFLCFSNFNYTC